MDGCDFCWEGGQKGLSAGDWNVLLARVTLKVDLLYCLTENSMLACRLLPHSEQGRFGSV